MENLINLDQPHQTLEQELKQQIRRVNFQPSINYIINLSEKYKIMPRSIDLKLFELMHPQEKI